MLSFGANVSFWLAVDSAKTNKQQLVFLKASKGRS
jgi:hypothetical protein